jgi:alcohol dehydrogenase
MNLISSYLCPTRVHLGIGAHAKIVDVVRSQMPITTTTRGVFIVVDAAVHGTKFFAGIRDLLQTEGVELAEFSEVEPDPSANTVHRAFDAFKSHDAKLVIAVGGGSSIDVAKAVCILGTNGGRIHDYEGIEKFSTPPIPLVAIPTTAGTGSEVSGSCVITDNESGRKMSVRHATLNPAAVALLDPLALTSLPAHVATHSGMDAFVHAFESFVSREANLITDAINLQAIELISANIRRFVANREDLDAGLKMLVGSCMAGMTFGQTGIGNVHCIARFVGAYFHLSHGLSNAVCLPHVARFNLEVCPEKYARVARAMGRSVAGLPELSAAATAIEAMETFKATDAVKAIEALCADLKIPARLRDVGADEAKLSEIAELCTKANYARWNPRPTSTADFKAILEQSF